MAVSFPRRASRAPDHTPSSLVVHNVVVDGHRTSVRLEPQMWDALQDIVRRRRTTVHDLVTDIDRRRTASSLTAAIRVYIVDFYRAAALHGPALAIRRPGHPRGGSDPGLHHRL